MTHNRQAFALIEVSVYLTLLMIFSVITFSVVTALRFHTHTILNHVSCDCMAFTTLQLLRIDLSAAQRATIMHNDLIIDTNAIVWRYDNKQKRLFRIAQGRKGYDHALIMEQVERWQLVSGTHKARIIELDLSFVHAGKSFKTRLYALAGAEQ